MIKTEVYAKISFLKGIAHDLELKQEARTIFLWDMDKLKKTLELLQENEIVFGSIIKNDQHYLITF